MLIVVLIYLSGTYVQQFVGFVLALLALGFVLFAALPWLLKTISDGHTFQNVKRPQTTKSGITIEDARKPTDFYSVWKDAKAYPSETGSHDDWSLDLLQQLEWKRFEEVARKFFELQGYKAKTTNIGADGGIDIIIYSRDTNEPLSLVQCKAWNSRPVGVKPVRELLGVVTHNRVGHGIFLTTGSFNNKARVFAQKSNLDLVDGPAFLKEIRALSSDKRRSLLQFATSGDYRTPTCPRCDEKMILKEGPNFPSFWGCRNYPRCRQKFNFRAA